jgi:Phosphate transporter family
VARAVSLQPTLPSPSLNKVGVLDWVFEARIPACRCLCLRFGFDLTINSARLKVRMDRVSFPVRLFHSRQHAGLSRRTQRHRISTHTITGAIIGVGATRRVTAVKWGVTRRIVWAWIITIPAAAAITAGSYLVIR